MMSVRVDKETECYQKNSERILIETLKVEKEDMVLKVLWRGLRGGILKY